MSLDGYFGIHALSNNSQIVEAVEKLASTNERDARGAVYTRVEVVEFILDLVGYKDDEKLYNKKILEPSFGEGYFLLTIIERLISSWRKYSDQASSIVEVLKDSICAVELHKETFYNTRELVVKRLNDEGISNAEAKQLAELWLIQGDFLLEDQTEKFDFIVGNPPYLRQEYIPQALLKEYRLRYKTMFDRADIYIAFIERTLSLLNDKGNLGFICSDRWMKNRYGGPLRNYISKNFNFKVYVDMFETDAFCTDVSAYPAITIISRESQGVTRIAYRPKVDRDILECLSSELTSKKLIKFNSVKELSGIVNGTEPWLMESTYKLNLLRKIESEYPLLEDVGCKVGIGIATGADRIFIQDYDSLDVEEDRKLRLVTTQDIYNGEINWYGQGVINTFDDNGCIIKLDSYPKLKKFLEDNEKVIRDRYIAKKNPNKWFRTIDKVWPELLNKKKLLIPDIKGEPHIVYDSGEYYPHHNLYYITSEEWDIRALQAVLLSNITKLFINKYSIKMRGEYLRFQAQYLRRIRIPRWENVSEKVRVELINATKERNIDMCNNAVFELYRLNKEERSVLVKDGE
ncbi:Eco57I restriction-modification methylase domain-containing protein [Sedimentibacter hydroxybenzoicus DSM 7310]|uniref:site-specific DNA-methyltransferase (adenine-specific) n=2 Tax=Sedimentibacter hydroxybenzoicus TaxID=29345 RepID=A0A974BKV9_SEDHY|nr:Eco57I restriction-modification methylase domain-containing protein [Sedimentibacter hydroxybenzoicus DSM 7310]